MTEQAWVWLAIAASAVLWIWLWMRVQRLEDQIESQPTSEDLHVIRESLARMESTLEQMGEQLKVLQIHLLERNR